jgi:hypothetical protein
LMQIISKRKSLNGMWGDMQITVMGNPCNHFSYIK